MSARLICGDVRDVLATLPGASVQCVVTSPPYFGLRDYGMPGQIGLEKSPSDYVAALVGVFHGVRRVLRDDGTVFLNLGDSYAGGGRGGNPAESAYRKQATNHGSVTGATKEPWPVPTGLKAKDLIGIPWRVAFALQADGWYLRSEIIWAKANCMPESVTDRPTKAHEQIFLLTKSERYYFDAAAIAEPVADATASDRVDTGRFRPERGFIGSPSAGNGRLGDGATRNARSVWFMPTQPYAGAHFATFPAELARRCILAGSSAKACEHCGAPWERVTERETVRQRADAAGTWAERPKAQGYSDATGYSQGRHPTSGIGQSNSHNDSTPTTPETRTVGWQPTCDCPANMGVASSVVLDPFGGSGTTAAVAVGHGRQAIHIDLNPAYIELARQRIGPMLCHEAVA